MKTKLVFTSIFIVLLLFTTAAILQAKLSGTINYNNPYAKVTAMCGFSYVDFKANNGTIYRSAALARGIGEQSCTYKILNVPSGTTGVLRVKLTLYSQKSYIYTCWYSERKITPTWLSGSINITSDWVNHPDSLLSTGMCQQLK